MLQNLLFMSLINHTKTLSLTFLVIKFFGRLILYTFFIWIVYMSYYFWIILLLDKQFLVHWVCFLFFFSFFFQYFIDTLLLFLIYIIFDHMPTITLILFPSILFPFLSFLKISFISFSVVWWWCGLLWFSLCLSYWNLFSFLIRSFVKFEKFLPYFSHYFSVFLFCGKPYCMCIGELIFFCEHFFPALIWIFSIMVSPILLIFFPTIFPCY